MQPRKEFLPNSDDRVRSERRRAPLPAVPREFMTRRELLALVPLSMSSIDALEKAGAFPSRFVLVPTVRVSWRRHEVERWLAERARRRVHAARFAEHGA